MRLRERRTTGKVGCDGAIVTVKTLRKFRESLRIRSSKDQTARISPSCLNTSDSGFLSCEF